MRLINLVKVRVYVDTERVILMLIEIRGAIDKCKNRLGSYDWGRRMAAGGFALLGGIRPILELFDVILLMFGKNAF